MSSRKTKSSSSGWISGNAVCCIHNNDSPDYKGRGGIISTNNSISYSCFNCGFKTAWQTGSQLPKKMIQLAKWLGADFKTIQLMKISAQELIDSNISPITKSIIPSFTEKLLPPNSKPISEWIKNDTIPTKLINVMQYMQHRNLYLTDHNFYYSNTITMENRLIIPFYYNNIITGYTARSINDNTQPRYLTSSQTGFVFNLDKQLFNNRNYVIVCEGPIDAIPIQAIATMGTSINKSQAYMINSLNKKVIYVPDKDHTFIETSKQALNYNWSVSLPDWDHNVKDINDSIVNYGRLKTLAMIMSNITNYYPKIITNNIWNKFK